MNRYRALHKIMNNLKKKQNKLNNSFQSYMRVLMVSSTKHTHTHFLVYIYFCWCFTNKDKKKISLREYTTSKVVHTPSRKYRSLIRASLFLFYTAWLFYIFTDPRHENITRKYDSFQIPIQLWFVYVHV